MDTAHQKSVKIRPILFRFAKHAAVALIFFSIGVLLFYRPTNVDPTFQVFNSEERTFDNLAQLIRSNGESVLLDEQRSVIAYQKSGELVVNNAMLKQF